MSFILQLGYSVGSFLKLRQPLFPYFRIALELENWLEFCLTNLSLWMPSRDAQQALSQAFRWDFSLWWFATLGGWLILLDTFRHWFLLLVNLHGLVFYLYILFYVIPLCGTLLMKSSLVHFSIDKYSEIATLTMVAKWVTVLHIAEPIEKAKRCYMSRHRIEIASGAKC